MELKWTTVEPADGEPSLKAAKRSATSKSSLNIRAEEDDIEDRSTKKTTIRKEDPDQQHQVPG